MEQRAPAGFTVRRARPADAAAVAALVAASQEALHGQAEISRASVLRKWQAPRFDLRHDAWLVETGAGRVVAFGAIRQAIPGREFEGNLAVHPDYYGIGLGPYLLDRMQTRARAVARASGERFPVFRTWSSSADLAACELYAAAGFRRVAVFLRMEKGLATEPEEPTWPAGIRPRPFRRGTDDRAVYGVLTEAFGEDPEDMPATAEEWSRDVVDDPRADLTLWLLACEGEEVVGAALCSLANGRGFIERLAVRPAWQNRGIGGALLSQAFQLLHRRNAERAILAVQIGVATEAHDLYRRAGMTETRHIEFFEKQIEAGART